MIPIRLADSEDLDDLDLEDTARASGPPKVGFDADRLSEYENNFSTPKQVPKRPAGSSDGTGARPKSTDSPIPTPESTQPATPAHPPSSLRKQVPILFLHSVFRGKTNVDTLNASFIEPNHTIYLPTK